MIEVEVKHKRHKGDTRTHTQTELRTHSQQELHTHSVKQSGRNQKTVGTKCQASSSMRNYAPPGRLPM